MNHKNWSSKKFWIVLTLVFFLGIIIAPKEVHPTETKVETKEVVVEKEPDLTNWKKLKEVDDQGFIVAGETLQLCSDGFGAISEGDMNTLLSIGQQVGPKTEELNRLATERITVLEELGY